MHPDSRYCRTCGHDFGRLYDKPIQCDVCCGVQIQAALMQPEIDRLRTQVLEYAETLAATRRESEMRLGRVQELTACIPDSAMQQTIARALSLAYTGNITPLKERRGISAHERHDVEMWLALLEAAHA